MSDLRSDRDIAMLEMVRQYFGTQHPLFRAMNATIVGVENGQAVCTMPCTPRMQGGRGALHRGAMVTLLDNTCGLSIFAKLGAANRAEATAAAWRLGLLAPDSPARAPK